jgi:hypothetical protein
MYTDRPSKQGQEQHYLLEEHHARISSTSSFSTSLSTYMTRVMHKDHIACLTVLTDTSKGVLDITASGRVVVTIIHKNQHFILTKAVHINEVLLDVLYIIVAATQLTLLTCVVDADCTETKPGK